MTARNPLLAGTALLAAFAALAVHAAAPDLFGVARVIDGDTIVINDVHIRLLGIDSPESRQTCEGRNGDVYECGRDARAVMVELTRGKMVACEAKGRDRYGRVVAVCFTDAVELNAEMVRRGWAVDYEQYSRGRYLPQQAEAKAAHLGIWSGRFEIPSEYRREHR